jgi:gamma-glutamylcysteine synthetase
MIAADFNYELKNANSNSSKIVEFPPTISVPHLQTDVFSAFDVFNAHEVLETSSQQKTNQNSSGVAELGEWSPKLEARFRRLAEDKALKTLSLKGKVEFEKLMQLRRQLKNPRTGEEILREYEQRKLTRDLVNALSQYVKFHQVPHR